MKAYLIGVDFETGDMMNQPFILDNPIDEAWMFYHSIKNDFPNYKFTVLADDEAIEFRVSLLREKMGLGSESMPDNTDLKY